ncbi:Regulatory protein RecX [Ostreococcus tauri]|uniref:Regulatory protein RecX n=1 Tax=Ostreococcus tauri TaxID=70448 RepID=A0A090MB24_OSTTA|nr:Regulatory protein RecX [Ostreococcus tauri]CEF99932.1 Regulatory protein RecX [Ostreococcus tauri]|eukprot:XP_022840116.1 Regulatory protein RecX [Ostreococcus tauri]
MFEALKGRDFSNVPLGTFRPTRVDEAKAQIARFLGARMRTKRELFEKLTRDKGYEEEDAIEALRAMEAAGAVSDAAYSEAFARHKWRTANWAAMRIRRSLREKGEHARRRASARAATHVVARTSGAQWTGGHGYREGVEKRVGSRLRRRGRRLSRILGTKCNRV